MMHEDGDRTHTLQAPPPTTTATATAKYADWKKGDWCWLLSSTTTSRTTTRRVTTTNTNTNNTNRYNHRHANTHVATIKNEEERGSLVAPASSTPIRVTKTEAEPRTGKKEEENIYLAAARRCCQTDQNTTTTTTGATKTEATTTPSISRPYGRKLPPPSQHQQPPATTTILKNERAAATATTKVEADTDTSHGNGAGGRIRTQGAAEDTVTMWRAGNWCWLLRDDEQTVQRRTPQDGTQQATKKTTTVTKKEEEGTGEEDPRKLGAREEDTIMSNTTAVGVVASNNIKNENGTKKKPEKTKKKKTQEPRIQDTGDTIHKIATAAAATPIESRRRKRLASSYPTATTLTEKDQPTSRGKKRKHTSIGSDRRIRHDTPHRMPPSSTTTTSVCIPKELRTYCNESNYWSIPATTIATRTIRQTRSFSTGGGAVTPSPSPSPSPSPQSKQRKSPHRIPKRVKKQPNQPKNTAIWKRLQIGSRVGIYWKEYKCYFPCTIEHRDEAYTHTSRCLVRYDDGTAEWTVLKLEKLRWLDEDDHLNDDIEDDTDDDRGEDDEEEEVKEEARKEDPNRYGNDERKAVVAVPENTSTNIRSSLDTTLVPVASTASADWKELVPSEESPEFPKSFVQILEMIDRFPDEVLLLKPPMYNLIMSKTMNNTTVVGDNDRRYSFAEELYHHARHGARKGIKTRNRLRDRQNAEGGGDPRLAWHHSKQAWSPTKRHDVCLFVEVLIEIAVDAWIWW